MTNSQFTISVKKHSNKIIGSSEQKFKEVTVGSLIQINDESYLYSVSSKDTFNYYNVFKTRDAKTLCISEEESKLQIGDTIKISYDEYEAKVITDIIHKGHGYYQNDIVTTIGGIALIDIFNGKSNPTIINISKINKLGEPELMEIKNNGKYSTPPENPIKIYGGHGSGLELEIKFLKNSMKPFIYRNIENIYNNNGETLIILDYSLPPSIEEGEIYCEKTIINLYETYKGETRNNCEYKVYNTFTPYLNMPLMLRNSLSPDVIFNKCLIEIDKKIQEIDKKLNN